MDYMFALYLDRASIDYDHCCLHICVVYCDPLSLWTSVSARSNLVNPISCHMLSPLADTMGT